MSPTRTLLAGAALASLGLSACGSDGGASPSPAPVTNPAQPTVPPAPPVPTTDGGGGSAQAGAPQFVSFQVSSPVACVDGNAEVTMSYETMNVVSIEIKIGDGDFAGTAGYGPNETSVVASIPCSGAGSSSIELKGCTESNDCARSPKASVEITA
jgi:hypothetical protein